MKYRIITTLVFTFLLFHFSKATNYVSISDGNWNDQNNWSPAGVPGEGDQVTIYDSIFVSSSVKVQSIHIENFYGEAILSVGGTDTLHVTGNVTAKALLLPTNVEIKLKNKSVLIIDGSMSFDRVVGNLTSNPLRVTQIGEAKLIVRGDYNYKYYSSSLFNEELAEIYLSDSSYFEVGGFTNIDMYGGKMYNIRTIGESEAVFKNNFTLKNYNNTTSRVTSDDQSKIVFEKNVSLFSTNGNSIMLRTGDTGGAITIAQNLDLTNTSSGDNVIVKVNNANSYIEVVGDVNIAATAANDIGIKVDDGYFALGGNIQRASSYGYLDMKEDALFIFNGSSPQSLPTGNLAGSGTDSLFFANVSFQNTSNTPITLTDDFYVNDVLELADAKIISSDWAMVILNDSASVIGGSENAYIQGPVKKVGRTNGSDLYLPIGSSARYAPITISEITDINSEMEVEYFSDPPPFGNNNNEPGLHNIMLDGYWNVERNAATGDVDVTLHWTDAADQGISNVSSLVVAGYDGTTVRSYGQEASRTTGGIGSGVGGSITSSYSDPPPFGIENFVFGSTSALNSLPIDLTKFSAIQKGKEVFIQWQTEIEINVDHYIIEHSENGVEFERMNSILSNGNSNSTQFYNTTDFNPAVGVNYYRLKIINLDGSFDYSHVEIVNFNPGSELNIYPNPVDEFILIQGTENMNGETSIEIFDQSGRLIFKGDFEFENGTLQISTNQINVNAWGNYFIRVTQNSKSEILKFIKMN